MPNVTSYKPGTPSWVDLGTNDLEGAKKFYGSLFDWTFEDQGEEAGHYHIVSMGGQTVCGMGPNMAGDGTPPHWTTYFAVADADASVAKISKAGGQVAMPPMDVMDAGRMAVCADPQGAFFAIWQANQHPGAGVVNEPGALCWNELNTTDPDGASSFYKTVFGLGVQKSESPEMTYYEWQLDGNSVGGMMKITPEMGPVPPNWLTYFAVADCDATVAAITKNGGQGLMGPMDIEPGRFAVAMDPQGAVFAIIALQVPPG